MKSVAGTSILLRLGLRRDRILLPAWISVLVLSAWSSAAATVELYPSVGSRTNAAEVINATPALVAIYGRIYDPTSLGAISMLKMNGLGAALVAVFAIIVTIRHTRADEEAGRLELVGAGVVGRQAALCTALLVAVLANVLLGVLTAGSLVAAGLPVSGSIAFGLAWSAIGIAFASTAAVVAQLASSSRSATGISLGVVGIAYLLRAVGDTAGPSGLAWLSPFGWQQQVRPFAGDRWWALGLLIGFTCLTTAGAFTVAARRDLGAGLLQDRPGSARADASLGSALGLAWRLQRGMLLWWAIAFTGLGIVMGGIASSASSMMDSPQARELFIRLGGDKGLTDAFLATEFGFVGIFASAYGIQAAMKLRTEETAGHAEPILTAGVGRLRWTMSHVTVALLGSAGLLAAAGLSSGVTYAVVTSDGGQVGRILAAGLVQIPAVWILTLIVVAAFGLWPRAVALGWVALAAFMLIAEVGPLYDVDQWVLDLSPFAHVPRLPGAAFVATPLIGLLAVASALLAAGLTGIRRRDLG